MVSSARAGGSEPINSSTMRLGDGTWREALPNLLMDKCSNDSREVIFAAMGVGDQGRDPAGPGTETGGRNRAQGQRALDSPLRLKVPPRVSRLMTDFGDIPPGALHVWLVSRGAWLLPPSLAQLSKIPSLD